MVPARREAEKNAALALSWAMNGAGTRDRPQDPRDAGPIAACARARAPSFSMATRRFDDAGQRALPAACAAPITPRHRPSAPARTRRQHAQRHPGLSVTIASALGAPGMSTGLVVDVSTVVEWTDARSQAFCQASRPAGAVSATLAGRIEPRTVERGVDALARRLAREEGVPDMRQAGETGKRKHGQSPFVAEGAASRVR